MATYTYILFLSIIIAERLNFAPLEMENTLLYSFLLFALSTIMATIYQIFNRINKMKIAITINILISFLLLLSPLLLALYALNFDSKITKDSLYAIFQSNPNESYEYLKDFVKTEYIVIFFAMIFISFTLIYLQAKQLKENKHVVYLLLLPTIFYLSSLYTLSSLLLPSFIIEKFEAYQHEIEMFREIQEKRATGEISFTAIKKAQGETYIVVIGESLNKNHMGVYGYKRKTTPSLSKIYNEGKILRFDNIYANHTHTMQVLSLALTEANQYNKKDYYNSLSIIDILNQSDIETYWLSNQNMLGGWDNLVSVIAHSATHITSINNSIGYTITAQKYDGELIPKVQKILSKKSKKNRIIFVHLIGNHTTYSTRYPKNYKHYPKNHHIDEYDNSILYNDHVVSSILKELQKQKGVLGFIYMPDHADDIDKNLGHGSAHFTFEMTEIPMLMYFSKEYQERYKNRYQTLSKNKNKLYSNDLFYDTLIGIFNIETKRYNKQYDLSSKAYQLNEKDALVLHGKRPYEKKKSKNSSCLP